MSLLDEWEDDYLRRVASLYPLTDEDKNLIQRVTRLTQEYGERGVHQLVSLAVGLKDKYVGLQYDFNPGQSNECAEQDASKAAERNKDRLRKMLTARKASPGEGDHIHLVWPCGNCRIWLIQLYGPDFEMILPFGDEVIKLPIRVLYPKNYSRRVRRPLSELERATMDQDWLRSLEDLPQEHPAPSKRYDPDKG